MKRFLVSLIMISFLISNNVEVGEVGRYQLSVSTYTSQKGNVFIVETVIDTKTGKVIKRKKIKASNKKIAFIDIDGVLADWPGGFLRWAGGFETLNEYFSKTPKKEQYKLTINLL